MRQSDRAQGYKSQPVCAYSLKHNYSDRLSPRAAGPRLQTTRHGALPPAASRRLSDRSREFSTFDVRLAVDLSGGGTCDLTAPMMEPMMVPSDRRDQVVTFVSACQQESNAVWRMRAGSQVDEQLVRRASRCRAAWAKAGCTFQHSQRPLGSEPVDSPHCMASPPLTRQLGSSGVLFTLIEWVTPSSTNRDPNP